MSLQERYDDAMYDFSAGNYDGAISKLRDLLADEPSHFDAQLSIGMAYFRKGDFATAITEGLKAEKMKPNEQLVHTNLSLFYMRAGDKATAEHHGMQARVAGWKKEISGGARPEGESELHMAKPEMPPVKVPEKFPEMPWKKKISPG